MNIAPIIWTICTWGVCYTAYRLMLIYAEMRLRLANAATSPVPERKGAAPLPPVVRMWMLWIAVAMGIINTIAAGMLISSARRPPVAAENAADARCTPSNCHPPKKCNGNTCTAQAETDITPPKPPAPQPTSSIEYEYAGGAASLTPEPDGIN